jgi:hypothetical protein
MNMRGAGLKPALHTRAVSNPRGGAANVIRARRAKEYTRIDPLRFASRIAMALDSFHCTNVR